MLITFSRETLWIRCGSEFEITFSGQFFSKFRKYFIKQNFRLFSVKNKRKQTKIPRQFHIILKKLRNAPKFLKNIFKFNKFAKISEKNWKTLAFSNSAVDATGLEDAFLPFLFRQTVNGGSDEVSRPIWIEPMCERPLESEFETKNFSQSLIGWAQQIIEPNQSETDFFSLLIHYLVQTKIFHKLDNF